MFSDKIVIVARTDPVFVISYHWNVVCDFSSGQTTFSCWNLVAYFGIINAGHHFERLAYADVLIISLTANWRLQKSRALIEDHETLRNEHEEEYARALKMLHRTGDLAPLHVMFSLIDR